MSAGETPAPRLWPANVSAGETPAPRLGAGTTSGAGTLVLALLLALILLAQPGAADAANGPDSRTEAGSEIFAVKEALIVVPETCDEQTRAAADLLAGYVEKSTGLRWPVVSEAANPPAAPLRIYVGQGRRAAALEAEIDKLDGDGFVIDTRSAGEIVIAGPTPWGTEFGVDEFLERYLGVRWLMPGPAGEDVPRHSSVQIRRELVCQQPVFFSRLMSGFRGAAQEAWARRQRMHGRVKFHHNLYRLIRPEVYAADHPAFFPMIGGKRYLPPPEVATHWQPCFSAPGIVDEAVKQINHYFDENPQETSYSLGVNDSGGHCECPLCRAKDHGEPNFIGKRDMSDAYYAWCNAVIAGVLARHPDKYFGCLAYSEVAAPPGQIKLNERLIPFMTYDRMKWIVPEIRAQGEAATESWTKRSSTLGWYDYIYGVAYCAPRVWFHHMADYHRTAERLGVKALYAEAYPSWGEGPKLYLAMKLSWNPRLDVDKLLDEWYERAVGKAAAGDLAAYYAHWEDFWTRRILKSQWFTPAGQYLAFHTPTYLADVTDDDLAVSRQRLQRVVARAGTAEQKARAGVLMLAWQYYEASALAYRGNRLDGQEPLQSEQEALARLAEGQRALEMGRRRLELLLNEFPRVPALAHSFDLNRRPNLRGEDWGSTLLWNCYDWAAKSAAVRAELEKLAKSPIDNLSQPASTMLALVDHRHESLAANPSFESPQGGWPPGWLNWITETMGKGRATAAAAHSGRQGLTYQGVRRGGPHQMLELQPGRYAVTALVRVPQSTSGNATVAIKLLSLDDNGRILATIATTIRASQCGWTRLVAAGDVAAAVSGSAVDAVRLCVVLDGFAADERVDIDDVNLYRLH